MTTTRRALRPELVEIAREQCNEDVDSSSANIIALQTWIRKSPHLKACTDEQLLLSFLRSCHFSLEDTKRRIDSYYSLKNAFSEVLCQRCVNDSLMDLYRRGVHIIPSKPISANGARLIISQYSKYDPKITRPRDCFKLLFMLMEILAIEDDNASVAGVAYVVDGRDVSMEQMMQYDPFLLKKSWMLIEHAMPLRFVEIHLINMKRGSHEFFKFVTTFLPKEMPFKFLVHKRAEDLYAHIPSEAMTIEYGGNNGYQAEALEDWGRRLQKYERYFAEDANYGTNEKLRVGLATNWETGELSGMSGSFRKLEVD